MKNRISFRKSIVVLVGIIACGFLTVPGAFAEDKALPSEAVFQFGGLIPHDSSGNGITDHSNKAGEFTASYSYQLAKWAAVAVEGGRSRYTQNFSGSIAPTSVQANVRNLAIDYVMTVPLPSKRVHPYGVVGTGMLRFKPTANASNPAGASQRTRAEGIFGVGSDFDITKNFGVRADYRLVRFKAPDFFLSSLNVGTLAHFTEPSIGIYFKFGFPGKF